MVDVKIEYCAVCDYSSKCEELAKIIKLMNPNTQVSCEKGRRGSFEIKVNDVLIHSKLQTMAFPEFSEVANITKNASEGLPIHPVVQQQPITDCNIM